MEQGQQQSNGRQPKTPSTAPNNSPTGSGVAAASILSGIEQKVESSTHTTGTKQLHMKEMSTPMSPPKQKQPSQLHARPTKVSPRRSPRRSPRKSLSKQPVMEPPAMKPPVKDIIIACTNDGVTDAEVVGKIPKSMFRLSPKVNREHEEQIGRYQVNVKSGYFRYYEVDGATTYKGPFVAIGSHIRYADADYCVSRVVSMKSNLVIYVTKFVPGNIEYNEYSIDMSPELIVMPIGMLSVDDRAKLLNRPTQRKLLRQSRRNRSMPENSESDKGTDSSGNAQKNKGGGNNIRSEDNKKDAALIADLRRKVKNLQTQLSKEKKKKEATDLLKEARAKLKSSEATLRACQSKLDKALGESEKLKQGLTDAKQEIVKYKERAKTLQRQVSVRCCYAVGVDSCFLRALIR